MLLQPQSIDTGMSPLEIAKDGYKGGRMDSEKYNETVKLLESAQSGQSINQSMDNMHLLKSSHARSIKMRFPPSSPSSLDHRIHPDTT